MKVQKVHKPSFELFELSIAGGKGQKVQKAQKGNWTLVHEGSFIRLYIGGELEPPNLINH